MATFFAHLIQIFSATPNIGNENAQGLGLEQGYASCQETKSRSSMGSHTIHLHDSKVCRLGSSTLSLCFTAPLLFSVSNRFIACCVSPCRREALSFTTFPMFSMLNPSLLGPLLSLFCLLPMLPPFSSTRRLLHRLLTRLIACRRRS